MVPKRVFMGIEGTFQVLSSCAGWLAGGAGTGETRGQICRVAGAGGEEFVNQERDLTASVIDQVRPVRFDRVKIASRMAGFGFGRHFEAGFGALAWLVAPRLSFAPWFVPVGG